MDRIYANSFLTIVAASGKDANAGLPGVSKVHRRQQQEVRVGNITLLQSPDLGHIALGRSTWVTRGWTYQEAYFSTRRLIFTDEQILFLCNEVYSPEALRCPLSQQFPTTSIYWKFWRLIPNHSFVRDHDPTSALSLHIEEYSRRQLSYPTDALNAILSVLNWYYVATSQNGKPRVSHVNGVPVSQSSDSRSLRCHLFWKHASPAQRRPEFPSWSWAGWEGTVEIGHDALWLDPVHCDRQQALMHEACTILTGEQDQVKSTLAKFVTDRLARPGEDLPQSLEPRALWISCLVVPLQIRDIGLSEQEAGRMTTLRLSPRWFKSRHRSLSGRLAVLPLCNGIKIGAPATFDQLVEQGNEKSMRCLLLNRVSMPKWAKYYLLIVKQVNMSEHERIGLICLEFSFDPRHGTSMAFLDAEDNLLRERSLDLGSCSVTDLCRDGAEEKMICLV